MKPHVILTATLAGVLFTKSLDEKGNPKKDKNGKEFGFLRVENPAEVNLAYAHQSGGVKRGQSALVSMTCEAWEKNKQYYKEGMTIPGRVRIVESLVEGPGFQAKTTGGENPIAVTIGGKQIYRKTEFDPTGELADELIAHDNGAVLSEAAKAKNARIGLNS